MFTFFIQLYRAERRELAALGALLAVCLAAAALCLILVGQIEIRFSSPFLIGLLALGVTAVYSTLLRAYLVLAKRATPYPKAGLHRSPSATAETAAAQTGLSSG